MWSEGAGEQKREGAKTASGRAHDEIYNHHPLSLALSLPLSSVSCASGGTRDMRRKKRVKERRREVKAVGGTRDMK